jgi:hypothetical protein
MIIAIEDCSTVEGGVSKEVEETFGRITEMSLLLSQMKDHQKNKEGETVLGQIKLALDGLLKSQVVYCQD